MMQQSDAAFDQPVKGRPRAVRRATMFIGVLVCLALCTLLMGTLVKSLVTARRTVDQCEFGLQSLLLADAGARRAVTALSDNPQYTGESWEIPAGTFGRSHTAVVTIRVQSLATDARIRLISIESQYPADPQRRVVCTREILVPGPVGGEL